MNQTVQSINRAFDILELFISDGPKLGVSQIAQKLDVNKSSISRIMTTLESKNYVKKENAGRKYQLASKVLDLARVYKDNVDLKELGLKYLKDINDITEETTHLDIVEGDKRISIASLESKRPIKVVIAKNNQAIPIHAGAAGKVLLAHLPENIVNQIIAENELPRYSKNTITDKFLLFQELKIIREEGVAFSESEFTDYVCSVAAPVKDYLERVIGAIAVSWPSVGDISEKKEKREKYSTIVKKSAAELSVELGYRQ